MALDLPTSDVVETPAADAAAADTNNSAQATTDQAAAPTPVVPAAEPAEPEDRRARRAAESAAETAAKERDELKAEFEQWKPLRELVGLAKDDPAEFITGLAAAAGLTPEKVIELIARRGNGDEAKLTAEDRVALLEKRLKDREDREEAAAAESKKAKQAEEYKATRAGNVNKTARFLKEAAKDFPACEADGDEAAEAVYEVVEARYAQLGDRAPKDQTGLAALYRDAAKGVEAELRKQTERRAAKLGYSKPTTVTPPPPKEAFKGLQLADITAPAPVADADRVNTPEEIEAIAQRMFS